MHLTNQMEEFSILLNQNFLRNMVKLPTRGNIILDLILTNDLDSCIKTEVDLNIKFSNHNLVTVWTSLYEHKNCDKSELNLEYVTEIPFFNWRYGTEEHWKCYEKFLDEFIWLEETRDMNISDKLRFFYET